VLVLPWVETGPVPLPTWLAIAGVTAWFALELLLRSRDTDATDWHGDETDRRSTVVLIASYGSGIVLAAVLGLLGVATLPVGLRWAGVALLAAGLGLRAWGMSVLGRFYSRTLRVVSDQHVVTAGPYRWIRHPGYAGSLLVWVGFYLGAGNWAALLVAGSLLVAAYVWRIRGEETMLVDAFGEEYVAYQRRTARLVPHLY
jgi:protein-S-isoprenylcysteine O-methyltransferase